MAFGYGPLDDLQNELDVARNIINPPEGTPLPIGVGFLVWLLEKNTLQAENLLAKACDAQVQAIWLSFGDNIGHWIEFIRLHDPNAGKKAAIKIFVQISTIDQALCALNNWQVDVIVAQGNEAGGHGLSDSLPILTLIPLLKGVIETAASDRQNQPPLLAAGGLARGSQIASLLALGASGVVIGTRFLLSPESLYTDSQREALLKADSSSSVRTMAFDQARNTLGWPEGVDGRGLRNDTVVDYENGLEIDTLRSRFAEGVKSGNSARMVVWAGSGVGLMNTIKSAKDITKELHEECLATLQRVSTLVQYK
ncbi:Nitronate monooxygenase-domain-containing protein [Crepidotus variabilis]|uniref:Nitronate monooxygenase-domain-containing protein n=1 Tax=Crepidotus variabilis TaxID=179855 RepID=A0A9P6JJL1_9AGAR|nr:Nitronate monooxygenase-domain-containing protein [Crepidotus variabilis]